MRMGIEGRLVQQQWSAVRHGRLTGPWRSAGGRAEGVVIGKLAV